MTTLTTIAQNRCFGGVQGTYSHESTTTGCTMRFGVYLPPQAETRQVPLLYWLSGLTCTEENFIIKAGAQRVAAELGIALVVPDTSPRGLDIPGEAANYDFGLGAGFYVDATVAPWSLGYRMYSYVVRELRDVVTAGFPIDSSRAGIFGHSMGGHGALTIALKNPQKYKSLSAFAPIAAPIQSPWGVKAFSGYLGAYRAAWSQYDATELVKAGHKFAGGILIDQGTADKFLADQLKPELLVSACKAAGQEIYLQMREGYDHGYFFIQSFIDDHLRHHAQHSRRSLPG